MKKFQLIALFMAIGWIITPCAWASFPLNDSGTMTVQGRLRSQAAVRTNSTQNTPLPIESGDLVQQRNSAIVLFDWDIGEVASGVTSHMTLQPRFFYDSAWDIGPDVMSDADTRASYRYFDQDEVDDLKWDADFFLAYLDLQSDGNFMRLGKQAFSWGEMTTMRILDGVNPLDSQGAGVDMEERLVPLWIARGSHTIYGLGPFDSASLEGYFIPGGVEHTNGEDLPDGAPALLVPLGLRTKPALPTAMQELNEENDRYGFKLGMSVGDLQFNLAHYRMYAENPTSRVRYDTATIPGAGTVPTSVHVDLVTEDIKVYGGSFNYAFSGLDFVLRGEAAIFKDMPLNIEGVNSGRAAELTAKGLVTEDGYIEHSDVYRWGLGVDKFVSAPWLNRDKKIFCSFEYVGSQFADYDSKISYPWTDPDTDKTLYKDRYDHQLIAVASTEYWHQRITTNITGMCDLTTRSLMAIPSIVVSDCQQWEVELRYQWCLSDTYKGFGFKQDSNELQMSVSYLF
ncbi:DUF1302 family protein [Desulfoluna sp.]|uniref:DUF1302 family protein n=1 Tax=Desulfoluna sp. TaxID=2045199 RepID=UPI00262E034B|nr:DUF1302 family protein [Desulfoluna sp.]